MRNAFLISIVLFGITSGFGQQRDLKKISRYSIGVQYTQEFVLGGYVQVREWELPGDKMNLKDLGMKSYPAVQFHVAKQWRNGSCITIAYDHYFMQGRSTFDRDITYNGTIINGRKGIDVSPTRYFRVSAFYTGSLADARRFKLWYKA